MKYKRKKRKSLIKVRYLIIIFVFLLFIISYSYSLWSTNLNINGTITGKFIEEKLEVEVVSPANNPSRLSTNTSLKSNFIFPIEAFRFVKDEYQGNNTVVTSIANANTTFITQSINPTFTFVIKNNSGYTFTDPSIKIEEKDINGMMTPKENTANTLLSSQIVKNGENVTLKATINLKSTSKIPVGSYINYKIGFICNGIRNFFNYKVLISA